LILPQCQEVIDAAIDGDGAVFRRGQQTERNGETDGNQRQPNASDANGKRTAAQPH
jgi:hypothetical protein